MSKRYTSAAAAVTSSAAECSMFRWRPRRALIYTARLDHRRRRVQATLCTRRRGRRRPVVRVVATDRDEWLPIKNPFAPECGARTLHTRLGRSNGRAGAVNGVFGGKKQKKICRPSRVAQHVIVRSGPGRMSATDNEFDGRFLPIERNAKDVSRRGDFLGVSGATRLGARGRRPPSL